MKPEFKYHKLYFEGLEDLFQIIQASPDNQSVLAASLIIKNGIVLLNGTYGTGKTQFVNMVKKIFFSDGKGGFDYDYETCNQDLTAFDVLYHLDLAELQNGKEIVYPKKIVSSRFKFLNEILTFSLVLYSFFSIDKLNGSFRS